MTVSDGPGVKETLSLLAGLREKITACAGRERSLKRTLDHITGGQDLTHEAAVEEENARFEAAAAAENTALREAQQRLERWDTQRQARVKAALSTARIKRLDRIESARGREIYAVQQGRLNAAREKAAALQESEAHLAGLAPGLENARLALLGLQRKTRASFRGYGKFGRMVTQAAAAPWEGGDADSLIEEFNALYPKTVAELGLFRKRPAPAVFRLLPVWLLVPVLAGVAGVQFVPAMAFLPAIPAALGAGVLIAIAAGLHVAGGRSAEAHAAAIAGNLARLASLYQACVGNAQENHQAEIQRIEAETAATLRALENRWQQATREAESRREIMVRELGAKSTPLAARHEAFLQRRRAMLEDQHAEAAARLTRRHEEQLAVLSGSREDRAEKQLADNQARWQEIEEGWKLAVSPLFDAVKASVRAGGRFPAWDDSSWQTWTPPMRFGGGVPFGHLNVNLNALCETLPRDERLALPGPETFSLPMLLRFPQEGSLFVETTRSCGESVAGALNGIILRLLAESPAGRLNFTILDPVGLGQNFAGVMHLADYEDSLINKRIWTQAAEIEQRLSDLNKHIEKVIQLHLRNEYPTIREYNEQAGNIAEKYHFLVIADFPVNFSDSALRNLVNIAVSGARCGVYTLVHWDRRHDAPRFVLDELKRNSICLTQGKGGFELDGFAARGAQLTLEAAPAPEVTTQFLHKVGVGWKDSNRIEVPFSLITPSPEEIWSLDTAEELRVPIGRAGAAKLQYLAIGKGTRQHTLIGGKTGSGKSTLFHVMVTNLALWYSPDQVEFYLSGPEQNWTGDGTKLDSEGERRFSAASEEAGA